jgi:hypothetical protein
LFGDVILPLGRRQRLAVVLYRADQNTRLSMQKTVWSPKRKPARMTLPSAPR